MIFATIVFYSMGNNVVCNVSTDNLLITLLQVEKGVDSFFTEEYKRFEIVLRKAIYNNENKRVDFYYRFVYNFSNTFTLKNGI